MLCREGKLSLLSYLSSILISILFAILELWYFSLELNSLKNSSILFGGTLTAYICYCVLALFCLPKDEWDVSSALCNFQFTKMVILSSFHSADCEESLTTWIRVRDIHSGHSNITISMEMFGHLFCIYVVLPLF